MILFIHPRTELILPEIVPLSLPALIHRLGEPVQGRFHDEWTEEEVKKARIILMDVHWYLSLRSALRLSHRIKRINPRVVIIVGGLSATIFTQQLLRDSAIDYVVRGDAEVPLALLVDAVLNSKPVETIPNISARGFTSAASCSLTAEDLDRSRYQDLSFFPSLDRKVRERHRHYRGGVTIPVYPYLVAFRGCPAPCPVCTGSPLMQQRVFGRGSLVRSAHLLRADLEAWSRDPGLRFVNMFHDFITTQPASYTAEVFAQPLDLDVSLEFFDVPTREQVELLLRTFKGGKLLFCMDRHHNSTKLVGDVRQLVDGIKQVQRDGRYAAVLAYVRGFLSDPHYAEAFQMVRRETGVPVYRADFWWENFPMPGLHDTEADYQHFLTQDDPFLLVNQAYRAGLQAYRLFPRFARAVAHRLMS